MPFFKRFSRIRDGFGRVYLDYASSTPVDRRMLARAPRIPRWASGANPSALHKEGVVLRRIVREAHERCAKVLDVHADEIIFTSGATESDHLAIHGIVRNWMEQGIAPSDIAILSSELEHAAVSESIVSLTKEGVRHVPLYAPEGIVEPKAIVLPEEVRAIVVSVMYVNNEIGTIQPIAEIAKRIRKLKKEQPEIDFVFHTDATQAPAHMPLRIPSLGVDMMTLGAAKLYCPKGVGILYKKRSLKLVPTVRGGGQEGGMRPGTEPVALIHVFAFALQYAKEQCERYTARTAVLQQWFELSLLEKFPQLSITARQLPRSPHITHVAVPSFDSELLVLELDAKGIAVSAKSACKNDSDDSPLVASLYGKDVGAVRFSFGRWTTKRDLARTIHALESIFKKYEINKN
ncbi:aminotransferase class V-fold PLP-dependent enzyme [Candidatus Nomurabacteria bacterium]|nr:aminotransferase class V-fold PLP-dependent enzyme [Candidatus Nomurabacteria bacterium]